MLDKGGSNIHSGLLWNRQTLNKGASNDGISLNRRQTKGYIIGSTSLIAYKQMPAKGASNRPHFVLEQTDKRLQIDPLFCFGTNRRHTKEHQKDFVCFGADGRRIKGHKIDSTCLLWN